MSILSNFRVTFIINLLFVIATAILLNSFLNYTEYTLDENGKWHSTKTTLTGLNGAYAYIFTKNGLSHNHLNIGTWHGYQEVLYKQPLKADVIHFKYLSFEKPFSFIINKGDSLSYGISFNYKKDSTCCLYIADAEGKFLYQKFFYAISRNNEWNDVIIKHSPDSVQLSINNIFWLQDTFKTPAVIKFGFRGSRNNIFIDDVSVQDQTGNLLLLENFSPPFKCNLWTCLFILIWGAGLLFTFNPRFRSSLTAFNMSVFIAVAVGYWFYYFYLSDRFIGNPDFGSRLKKTVTFDHEDVVCEKIRNNYSLNDSNPMIMILGSSQTWGAGKTQINKAYPAVIERNLRNYFHDSSFTVINTGICGATAGVLFKDYSQEWYKHKPLLTIIDLSNNDTDTSGFKENIRKFLEFNREQSIKTLFLAEPNDYTNDSLEINHRIMKNEGLLYGVKTIETQAYLDSVNATGFIWWDHVHMTDYGYHLFANYVTPEIISALKQDSLVLK